MASGSPMRPGSSDPTLLPHPILSSPFGESSKSPSDNINNSDADAGDGQRGKACNQSPGKRRSSPEKESPTPSLSMATTISPGSTQVVSDDDHYRTVSGPSSHRGTPADGSEATAPKHGSERTSSVLTSSNDTSEASVKDSTTKKPTTMASRELKNLEINCTDHYVKPSAANRRTKRNSQTPLAASKTQS